MLSPMRCYVCSKQATMTDKLRNVFCTNECYTTYTKATECIPHFNLERELGKEVFRNVFYTAKNKSLQLATQTLKPGEKIGDERDPNLPDVHREAIQVIIVFSGRAKVTFFSEEKTSSIELTDEAGLANEDMVIVPPNTFHLVENIGTDDLSLFTIYSPSVHADTPPK